MRPLFLDEATAWPPPDLRTQRQMRALREAIAPYLCLDDLRRLAASGASVQDALKRAEGLPEEVQALMSLLQVLLTPSADECIRQPADLAALPITGFALIRFDDGSVNERAKEKMLAGLEAHGHHAIPFYETDR